MLKTNSQYEHLYEENETSQESISSCAIVTLEKDDAYFVKYNGGLRSAKKAFSCLMKPQKNDLVDVKVIDGEVYILSILERVGDNQAEIELPESTKISSKGEISIDAQKIKQVALYHEMCANEAVNISKSLKSFVNECYQYSGFNQQKATKLLKEVSEFEQSIVEDLQTIVNKNFRVDAKSVDIVTEEDTVINAKSVSLG